jgi:Amt family ammonium transporter
MHQLTAAGIAWGFAIVGTLAILFVVDLLIGVRVSHDEEEQGLDLSQHGEQGYDWESTTS